jgi:uncharacterized protein
MTSQWKPRTVACPSCKGPSRYASDNLFRPFCSERCRDMDLGAWASEQFRVEAEPPAEKDDSSGPREPPH